ncbi:predicted Zn-dependent protease [Jatrophihabitans sp. GAS493]|uniref:TldD/PmbA family protein n=1 Tax=Jatrophihabitans sp. GAS493 TaxID=1907575 RepID=UPI000BB81A88|nr:TldD/PmbA family protein [Jatrophihabitans sp. GAS493]SOD71374.1 predicted Zn-dependent protease [Jatrophihabitans sp. GAS493]
MAQIQELVEQALLVSTADDCIVVATEHSETNLRWANNNLTTNGQMTSRSMAVISLIRSDAGTGVGVITRSVTTAEELGALVSESEAAARASGPAEDVMPLIEAGAPDAGYADDPAQTSVTVFADFATALGQAFDKARGSDRLLFGFAEHQLSSTFVASSTGLRRRYDQPNGRVEINAKSGDFARSAWIGAHTTSFSDIDVTALTDELHTRLDWAANSISLPAGRYETILPPTAVADLLIDAYWSTSSRDAEEGRSVFAGPDGATRIGERLATLPLTLRSDPAAAGIECAPFEIVTSSEAGTQSVFDNGAEISPIDWIRDGVLSNLARSRSWAQRSAEPPRLMTGNLILEGGGTASLEEMIASTKRGLLLTCLWYIREVDPQTLLLTGLTRDGVYLIEDGKVVGAVNNFRFNESPIDLLGRITEVGQSVHTLPREWSDYFTRASMPPVRVADFNMSTVSKAS